MRQLNDLWPTKHYYVDVEGKVLTALVVLCVIKSHKNYHKIALARLILCVRKIAATAASPLALSLADDNGNSGGGDRELAKF